jgi:hypothetical protein
MWKAFLAIAAILFMNMPYSASAQDSVEGLPVEINVVGGKNHVQGIALDKEAGRMYFSFTTSFVVTDLQGNVLGSIDRIQGHLGAMAFNPKDRKVYESLECKDDEIGKGLSDFAKGHSLFYVAIIDVDKIDRVGIDVENTEIFKTVCIKDAVRDYRDSVMVDGRKLPHRYGCSGIDGVAIAPKMGKASGKNYLYVAYGIYGDVNRPDNDCQVLLRYDIRRLNRMARPVRFGEFDETGPKKPLDKIFINTGNTTYGVQNMAYDPSQHCLFMAVYKGRKPQFHNYSLFAVDFSFKPFKRRSYDSGKHSFVPDMWNVQKDPDIRQDGQKVAKDYQKIAQDGQKVAQDYQKIAQDGQNGTKDYQNGVKESRTAIAGHPELVSGSASAWDFKWGSTGICCVGNGLWYFSENYKDNEGREACRAHLYRWTGDEVPFERL